MRSVFLIFTFVALLLAGYFFNVSDFNSQDLPTIVIESECDLRQGNCELPINNTSWLFEIEPNDFDVLQPLKIVLRKKDLSEPKGENILSAQVEFEGINMDMGYNLVKLQPVDSNNFQAMGMLPDCTAETMYWLVHLNIVDAGQILNFRFKLTT